PAASSLPMWRVALAEIDAGSRTDQGRLTVELPSGSVVSAARPERPGRRDEGGVPVTAGAGPRLFGFLPARTQRQAAVFEGAFGILMHLLMVGLVTAGILVGSAGGVAADRARAQELTVAGLRQDLLEQEVGIGAYAASADARRLGVYTQGRQDVNAALVRLRQETAGTSSGRVAARVESAAAAWQQWAEGVRERVA